MKEARLKSMSPVKMAGERGFEPAPAGMKRCSRCGEVKPLDDFHRYSRSNDGHGSWCKTCASKYWQAQGESQRDRKRRNSRERYLRLGDEIRRYNRERNQQLKAMLVAHYSNGANKCVCCGESEVRFLTIDHIDGNGAEHRKTTKCGTGATFYRRLIREGMPEGYQVLCYNCNNARIWNKKCPHQLGRN